jgi:hypothetical protein
MSQKQNARTANQVERELAFRGYSTADVAKCTGVKPASIRTALWRNGHFYGVKPIRLGGESNENAAVPGGRLVWPADEIDALLQRGAA